ncbi:MAG: ABC transporter permease [Syntrophales bacterium]|jgi:putative ABC transport system permease protein|nr:ABC transporter permease [Syntrophales bacterium]
MDLRRILLNLKIARRSLVQFKWRTSLAVLGVFFGTFSLIIVSNLSGSLAVKTEQEIDSLGKNLLIVRSGIVRRVGAGTPLMSQATTLTPEDARAIRESIPAVADLSAAGYRTFPVRYGNVSLKGILVGGVEPNFQDIRNFRAREGSFIADQDNLDRNKVAVLGRTVVEKLFGDEDPIGKYILIWRVPFQVIGIMEEKGSDVSGADQDNQIFIPLQTYLKVLVNKTNVSNIFVQVTRDDLVSATKTDMETLLRKRHKIGPGQNDDFAVIDMKDVMALKAQAMDLITVLGRIAAAISFIIGGLGILSIMILIVNERKLEIGIRRAVGSRKRDIVLQFLIESSIISLAGGMIGVFSGALISVILLGVLKYPFTLSLTGLAIAFGASVLVGVLAGIYPSKKATQFEPVDILRT